MENSAQFEDMITRSLSQELSEAEQASLAAWLSAGEENRLYYETLQKAWHLAGIQRTFDNDAEQDWERFRQAVEEDEHSVIDIQSKKRSTYKWLLAGAAAAAVLIVMGLGWNRLGERTATVVADVSGKTQPVVMHHEHNTSDSSRRLQLQDGSEVWLEPAGELSWQEPFYNRRDIRLKGEARFKVATDRAKPFTVYSGPLSTVVLGTVFTVRAFPAEDKITVRLYAGKVAVRSADSIQPVLAKDFYLSPGQELVYDNNRKTARVSRFTAAVTDNDDRSEGNTHKDNPSVPAGEKGSWYMFNNQSLVQVFAQLEALYGVEIMYSQKDIQKIYFIGKFSKSDSVETILKQITALNNLTLTRQNNTFIIGR